MLLRHWCPLELEEMAIMCVEAWRDSDKVPRPSQASASPGVGRHSGSGLVFWRHGQDGPGGSGWKLLPVGTTGGNTRTAGCSPSHSFLAMPAAPAMQGLCGTSVRSAPDAPPTSQGFHYIPLAHGAAGRSQSFQNKSCTNTAVQLLHTHLSYTQPSSSGSWRRPSVAVRGHEGAKKQMSLR